jgi:uncharacterized repeat protein (TIGR01451 family)
VGPAGPPADVCSIELRLFQRDPGFPLNEVCEEKLPKLVGNDLTSRLIDEDASDTLTLGDRLQFGGTFTNQGPAEATGVTISLILPAVNGSWQSQVGDLQTTRGVVNGQLVQVGTLAANASVTVTATITAIPVDCTVSDMSDIGLMAQSREDQRPVTMKEHVSVGSDLPAIDIFTVYPDDVEPSDSLRFHWGFTRCGFDATGYQFEWALDAVGPWRPLAADCCAGVTQGILEPVTTYTVFVRAMSDSARGPIGSAVLRTSPDQSLKIASFERTTSTPVPAGTPVSFRLTTNPTPFLYASIETILVQVRGPGGSIASCESEAPDLGQTEFECVLATDPSLPSGDWEVTSIALRTFEFGQTVISSIYNGPQGVGRAFHSDAGAEDPMTGPYYNPYDFSPLAFHLVA